MVHEYSMCGMLSAGYVGLARAWCKGDGDRFWRAGMIDRRTLHAAEQGLDINSRGRVVRRSGIAAQIPPAFDEYPAWERSSKYRTPSGWWRNLEGLWSGGRPRVRLTINAI